MVANTSMGRFSAHSNGLGKLVAVEGGKDVPFQIRRIYYIYEVPPDQWRGFHSHRDLHQALICVHGSVTIRTMIPGQKEDILLDDPSKVLFIGPMVWREMYQFSEGAVLLVLADHYYTESDYIRSLDQYMKEAIPFWTETDKR